MGGLRTSLFVLLVLVLPVSGDEVFFTEPVTCYFLDGVLIIYCIFATALYFREKFFYVPSAEAEFPVKTGGLYQELLRPSGADPYTVLETPKRKSPHPNRTDEDAHESPGTSAPPPLSYHRPPAPRDNTSEQI
ncbi:T-cell surface glycoprotein CD3 zeta chain-like [Antennarius striatus]|uniref:T-cell surface glycoprotein CD3 zeta chain-like n=1 Tax=Antennarius striatus TaxID=241820 RepID=UPI0035B3349D